MKPLLIIKTGQKIERLGAFPGDYDTWIARGMELAPERTRVVAVAGGEALPAPDQVAAVAITGSAAMVTERLPWMVETEAWLREAVARALPVLGICFGHQLLAQATGGEVAYNPRGLELGSVALQLTRAAADDPLFGHLPPRLPVQVTHRQTVVRLPREALLLATSALDDHQAFRLGRCAWGVQFHPEFEAGMMVRFVEHHAELLAREGQAADELLARIEPTPLAHGLLRRFAELAGLAGGGARPGD